MPSCGKIRIHFLANPHAFLLENTHYLWFLISCGQQVSWFLLPRDYIILVSFLAKFSGMMSTYWCPRSHCSFFRVFSVLVYHSCWIYLRVGKSTPVKLCRGLNRKSFTWLLHNSALTHATQNPVVPVTCHLVRLSRLGRKCFLTVWVWRCKVSLLPLFPRVALPQTGTCWGVIRAVLIWTAKSWLQWEEKQEMF